MATDEEIFDSPTGWINQHIQQYVKSGGRKGHHWRGQTSLLLTTRGRKSGKLRRTALIYGRDGERYLLVASNGGAEKHPAWLLNLQAAPNVTIQVGEESFAAQARIADADERERLWPIMSALFPLYDSYQKKASKAGREIPLVILERQ